MNASSPGGRLPSSDGGGEWPNDDQRAADPRSAGGARAGTQADADALRDAGGVGGSSAANHPADRPEGAGLAGAAPPTDLAADPGSDGDSRTRRRGRPAAGSRGRGSFLRELPVLVLVAFLLALLIKALLVQAFWIPSESMERTLLINDRVLVNKVIYHFRDVHRGEIVVFNGKGTGFDHAEAVVPKPTNIVSRFVRGAQGLLGLGAPSETDFIKRVIAVGGDTVTCCDAEGRVTVNGQPLDEPYVYQNDYQRFDPVKVPEGYLWVMGDHRGASSDARQNGPIPQSAVVGRAFVRVWPLSRFGFLGVPGTFSHIPAASGAPAAAPSPAPPTPAALGLPGQSAAAPVEPASLVALAFIPPAWRVRRRWSSRPGMVAAASADRHSGAP